MSFSRPLMKTYPSASVAAASPDLNQPSRVKAASVVSGCRQYPEVTLGPETRTSPVSPAAASVRSGRTTLTSVKKHGVPAEPVLRTDSGARRNRAPGDVSVRPYPCAKVSPRSV
jgi:hypothetical protein